MYGLDWKLVAAISGVESGFGKVLPSGSHNAWGWGIPTGSSGGIKFASWEEGIATVSHGLKTKYVNRGAHTIDQIGSIYAASPAWPGKVRFFMNKIHAYVPDAPDLIEFTI